MPETKSPRNLVDHFFRHEYGRVVSLLTRHFGFRGIDVVEDAVQNALVQSLHTWPKRGVPDNPTAWIVRAAKNKLLDHVRYDQTVARAANLLKDRLSLTGEAAGDDAALDTEIEDSQLRMIFACCHPSLSTETQIALTLKTLCGFSIAEVARGLLISEENAKKRITRAKQNLIAQQVEMDVPSAEQLPARLSPVHAVLYLLFNEGYCATAAATSIRCDLCEEAARLCHLLCNHSTCNTSNTFALMALMLFHAGRLDARIDRDGCVVLLEEQDRSKWDYRLIGKGLEFLQRAAQGDVISHYHLEAGIAMYHCKARSFADTNWQAIVRHYDMLIRAMPSPVYLLNRAIALAYAQNPQAGIAALREIERHPQMRNYHLYDATLAELHRQAGDMQQAVRGFQRALEKAQSDSDRELIRRRIDMCQRGK